MKSRWPVYKDGPLTGPGCGQANHTDDCLCDVKIPHGPKRPSVSRPGAMKYESTAELALKRRGITDPEPLQVMRQLLALKDALAVLGEELAPIAVQAAEVPEVDSFHRAYTYEGAAGRDRNPHAQRQKALKDLITANPRLAHTVIGMTRVSLVAEAYGLAKASVERLETLALGFDTYAAFMRAAVSEGLLDDKARNLAPMYSCLAGKAGLERPRKPATDVAQARELFEAGWSMASIARTIGVKNTTVYRWVTGARRPEKGAGTKPSMLNPEQWNQLRADYMADTLTMREIGQKYGVSQTAIWNYTVDLPRRKRGPKSSTPQLVAA